MVRNTGLAKSRRVAGVCFGLATIALVPGGQLIYQPNSDSDTINSVSPGDSIEQDATRNGQAIWSGFDWIVVKAPEGEEAIPPVPSSYLPGDGIDADYANWEAMQVKIAEIDLVRRLANDDRSARNVKLRSEYNTWEASRADKAKEELEHRLALAAEAAREVDTAAQRVQDAQAQVENASGQDRDVSIRKVEEAAAALESAIAVHEYSEELLSRIEQRAMFEENHQANLAYSSIVALGAQREAEAAAGMGVRIYGEPVEMVTVENLNLRRGPGVGYEKIGEVAKGTPVTVTGKGHDFYRISTGGYLPAVFVTTLDGAALPDDAELNLGDLISTGALDNGVPIGFGSGFGGNRLHGPNSSGFGGSGLSGTPVDPPSKFAFQSYVANVDSQEAVDACTGGLTYSPDISKILGKQYYPIHNYCGGMPILELENGNKVNIEGVGTFTVVDGRDVVRGDTTTVLTGIKGSVLLQTCYPNSTKMRVVGLEAAKG